MGESTGIQWTDATWNPWHGCHKISAGCKNCYMFRDKARFGLDPNIVQRSKTAFHAPLGWKDPKRIFTCSWSDFFIEEADSWRDEAYWVIRATPQHTYQILTKRPYRIVGRWPEPVLQNVWLGVSVEDQATADARIPELLDIPAALRFVSYEPALGPVDFLNLRQDVAFRAGGRRNVLSGWTDLSGAEPREHRGLDWVIVGGESGPNARVFQLQWARDAIEQCRAAGVACFVKQLGAAPALGLELGAGRLMEDADPPRLIRLRDPKGGDMTEWEPGLRVREFPR